MTRSLLLLSRRLFLLALCAPVFHAWAQTQDLTQKDAIARALENNLGIQWAKQQAELSAIGNAWGAAGALPQIAISASGANGVSDQSQNPTSFIQERLESQSVNVGGQLNWMLFDGLGMFANKRSLEFLSEQSNGQAALVIEETVSRTMRAYNAVLVQNALLEVLSSAMDVSKERLNWINTRSEMGAATVLDGLQFENSLLLDSLSWLQQNASARESVSALNRLMGEDAGREWVLDSDLNEPENDWDFAILHQEVMGNATAIQNALISREIARVGVQQAKSRVSPKLLLSANQSDQGSRFRAGEITQDGRSKNLTANLTLSFNVFDGGATRRAIEQAYIQLAIAENRAEDERREVSQIVHDFWSRWTTARGAFFISRKIVTNSDRALEIAKQRLASGGINSIDFREIQLQLVNARQQEVQSLNEWQSADIELRRLAGEWMFKSLD